MKNEKTYICTFHEDKVEAQLDSSDWLNEWTVIKITYSNGLEVLLAYDKGDFDACCHNVKELVETCENCAYGEDYNALKEDVESIY